MLAVLAIAMLGFAAPASAQVKGRIVRVGLFAGAKQTVRPGTWTFVEVDLSYTGMGPLDGELRVEQRDRDGDIITAVADVALAPNGENRRFPVYFTPQAKSSGEPISVALYDRGGALVKITNDVGQEVAELTSDPVYVQSPDEFLVVDLTGPRKSAHASWIESGRVGFSGDDRNTRAVRSMSPDDLPSRWQGLAMVDAILWDDADLTAISAHQADALIEWVRNGGRLLLTSGRTWQGVAKSPLAEILPVTLNGVDSTTQALEFQELIGEETAVELKLENRYLKNPILRCRMTPVAGAMPIPRECRNSQIAWRRLIGRGQVTFVGASLQQLLPPPARIADAKDPDSVTFQEDAQKDPFVRTCRALVAQNFLALPVEQKARQTNMVLTTTVDVFETIRRTIDFGALSAGFLVFAVVFAGLYWLAATVGSRWWLVRRGWQRHCWSAFAIIAVLGSVIGTGMVWTLRGFSTRLIQTSVIDLRAGRDEARASCLFGVKTPDHTRLNVALPSSADRPVGTIDQTLIAPMPDSLSIDAVGSRFVAPDAYRSVAGGGRLEGVPVRATLKEFLGVWKGAAIGTVDGKLVLERDPETSQWVVAKGSTIRNNLGFDLRDCYLFETRYDTATASRSVDPSLGVFCYELGTIPKGGQLDTAALNEAMFFLPPDKTKAEAAPERRKSRMLNVLVKSWRSTILPTTIGFGGGDADSKNQQLKPDQEHAAMLLLSLYDLIGDWDGDSSLASNLKRSYGRTFGCSQSLTAQTMLLIGRTDEPPAAGLEVNETALRPTKAYTMYRVVIPVERK